ncbi:tetratricopeptide repeat protein [bacterium AH-315-I18]|nr:tetratricopeptide repeat protein [bacterium AH-315-I18]
MSGRVNTKFVVGLSATLVAIIVGLVSVWYMVVRTDPAEYIARADAMLAQGQYAKAVDLYRKARSGGGGQRVDLLLKQAQAMSQLTVDDSRRARAVIGQLMDLYKSVLDVDTRNEQAMRSLAEIYMQIGRELGDLDAWDQLFKITNTAVLSDPGNLVARQYRGIAQVNRMMALNVSDNDRDTARDDLSQAQAASPLDPDVIHHIALWHVLEYKRLNVPSGNRIRAMEHYKQAKALSESLLKEYPDEPRVKIFKLRVLIEMGLRDEADVMAGQLEKELAINPGSSDMVLEVARHIAARGASNSRQVQVDMALLTRAENLVNSAIIAHPTDLRLTLLQGQILTVMGKFDQAVAVLDKAANVSQKALPLVAYQSAQLRRAASIQHADLVLRQADRKTGTDREEALGKVEQLVKKMRDDVGDNAYVSMLSGKLNLARHNWGLALKQLDSASSQFNDRKPDILLLSASACAQLGELGAAVQRLETLLKTRPSYMPARMEMAKLQLRLSQSKQAKRQIDIIIRHEGADTTSSGTKQLLAIYYAQIDEIDKAISIYQKLDPLHDVQVALSLSRLQASNRQKSQALTLLTHHFNQSPNNISVLRELVGILGNAQQLEPYFQKAVASGVDVNAIALLKSKIKGQSGQSAVSAAVRIVQSIEDPFDRAMGQFLLNSQLGKNDLAQSNLRQAASLKPNHPRVIEAQFDQAIEAKDWKVAQVITRQAKEHNTDLAEGTLFAGRLELARGQVQSAVTLLGRGMKQRPVYSEGWRWLGQAQRAAGDLSTAIYSYQQAIRQRPDNLRAYEGLADAYDLAGQLDKSLGTWRKIMAMAPRHRVFREKYLAYEQAKGDPAKALVVRQKIAHSDPKDRGNIRGVAILLAHLKRVNEAKTVMQKLFADAPSDRANYGAYAAVLTIDDQVDQARLVIENYLKQTGAKAVADDYLLGARFMLSIEDKPRAFELYRQAIELDRTPSMQVSRELADALFSDSRFAQAAKQYQIIWEKDRQDGRVGFRLVEAFQRNQQLDQAIAVLDQLEQVIGQSATSLMLKAQIARSQDRLSDAIALLDQAVEQVPDDAMVYYQRASLLLNEADQENRVIEDLRHVLGLDPNFTAAYRMLAQIHLRHDSFDLAVKAYESVLTQNPDDVATRVDLLQMYINANDMLAAKTLLIESSRRFPSESRWPKLQADLAIRDKNHRQAAKLLLYAFELEPDSRILSAMGLEMVQANAAGMAVTKIEENPQLLASDPQLQAVLGRAKYKLGQQAQGKIIFLKALRQANSLQQVLAVCDQLVMAQGLIEARTMLQGISGTASDIWVQIAIARSEVGATKYVEAINRLKRIKSKVTDKEISEFRGLLSLALHNSGKFEEAVSVYEQVLLDDPNNFAALNNLAYLLATNLNRPTQALKYAEVAASSAQNDPQVLDTLGWVQFLAGQQAKAEATLRRSVRIKPFSANTYHLAEVMLKDGQTRYATELLDMARQLAQQSDDKTMLDKVNVRLKEVTQ